MTFLFDRVKVLLLSQTHFLMVAALPSPQVWPGTFVCHFGQVLLHLEKDLCLKYDVHHVFFLNLCWDQGSAECYARRPFLNPEKNTVFP